METKRLRQHRCLSAWFGAVLLAVSPFYVAGALAGAQAPHYRIAVLTPGLSYTPVLEGLQEELARMGYVSGKNVTFVVEETQGAVSDLAQRAAKLVAASPAVLVTVTTMYATAAKQATTSVPIVFTWVGDPLHSSLIASYASSQNNLTGISSYAGAYASKRLEILQEIAPGIKRVLALVATQESLAQVTFQGLADTAQKLGIQVLRRNVTTPEEIEQALRDTPTGAVDAIYHVPSTLVGSRIELLIQKARQEHIPLIVSEDSMVARGALVSYGANFRLLGIQAATFVAKLLKGAQAAEIPIQTPDKLFLAINLTTARALGLELPRSILERADRLVE